VNVQTPDKADHKGEEDHNHDGHAGSQHVVDTCGSLNAAQVESCENDCESDGQRPIGHAGQNVLRELAANHCADKRVQNVIHHHGPASDVAELRMNLLTDVGVGRASAGIGASHFP